LFSCENSKNGEYKNGIYKGETKSIYQGEFYWGTMYVDVKDKSINDISFSIIDRNNNEMFNQYYENHYLGNDTYIQQCRNDWAGMNKYINEFMKGKDLTKVDAITGATWSYNLFKDSLEEALNKAKGIKSN
jgi:major membrane immunogen (membrane-anchored lipoprotein)